MIIEYDRYSIAAHWAPASENGDYSGLSDDEAAQLEDFLATLPRGHQTWQWSDDVDFARDEVSGLMADCVEAVLWVNASAV